MNDSENMSATMKRLKAVLEIFGGDPARWPARERDRLLALVGASAEARTLFRQAGALDRLLSSNDPGGGSQDIPDVLMERLVAGALKRVHDPAATDDPGIVSERVIPNDHQWTGRVVPFRPSRELPRRDAAEGRTALRAAMLLAASLMLGVFLGASGMTEPAIDGLAKTAGLGETADQWFSGIGDDPSAALEEEFL